MIICSWYSGIGNFNYYPKFFFFFEFWMFEKCRKLQVQVGHPHGKN